MIFGCYKRILIPLLLVAYTSVTKAQKTTFRYFGHLETHINQELGSDKETSATFSLGEHDLFVTSSITDKISFLGETVVTLKSSGSFNASIERARIKFDYSPNHSIILGKMHTPINYWNDVYHHGRLFFPVIDRPIFFSVFMPIHTLGLRMQGQNIGGSKFGYDVVLGNGISSTDFSDDGLGKSFTAAFHFKPITNMRIGASYYRDVLVDNKAGSHSGHNNMNHFAIDDIYAGDINYDIVSSSFAYFGNKHEMLLEFSYNASTSDSLARANNTAGFIYYGYRPKKNWFDGTNNAVYYLIMDQINVQENDLHVMPQQRSKVAVGIRYEFSYLVNLKFQIERLLVNHQTHHHHHHPEMFGAKIQVAYGF